MDIDLNSACQKLLCHDVIAYPSESVWGLGCLPDSPQAIQQLLALKNRPVQKGLILVFASIAQVMPYLSALPAHRLDMVLAQWPGPHTWLIPANNLVSHWIRGEHSTVALRVSDHPDIIRLCQAVNSPLVSTSANPAGKPPARSMNELNDYFGVDFPCLTGTLGTRQTPSIIQDALSLDIIRR